MLSSKKKCNFAALFVFILETQSFNPKDTRKHTMVHLTNTSRSSIFRFGIGMLMLFFFCAPTLAQSSQGFKSTSAYQINASVQTSAVNADAAYQPYRSTIYSPFTGDAPSSGGPSRIGGRKNNDSWDEEVEGDGEDVEIPDDVEHPSDIMPLGETTFLYLLAGILALLIFVKNQRKQTNNHSASN